MERTLRAGFFGRVKWMARPVGVLVLMQMALRGSRTSLRRGVGVDPFGSCLVVEMGVEKAEDFLKSVKEEEGEVASAGASSSSVSSSTASPGKVWGQLCKSLLICSTAHTCGTLKVVL